MEDKRRKLLLAFRLFLIVCGAAVIALSIWRLASEPFDTRLFALALLAIAGGWLPSSQIPGDMGVVTVSDTIVFLTVLLCGADAGVLVAAAATASESARFTRRRLNFGSNVALISCALFLACALVNLNFGDLRNLGHNRDTFFIYAFALAMLAATQAVINHGLVVALVALESGKPMLRTWRESYSWVFVTSFTGLVTAAIVNALIYYYGFAAVAFALPVLLANYLAYRPYLKNIVAARRHVEETRALHLRTLEAFATAVDAKDQITHEHVQRVQIYADGLACLLGLTDKEREALHAGALLHDIGKIAVPDYILNKPGKLTAAEFDKMKLHTVVGAQILERIKFPYPLVPIVRHHHERWDGSGYPDGLQGEEIPLTARILTVVDCFDALREDRQYRRAMTREEAIELLRKDSGTFYDAHIVKLFIENLPTFEAEIASMKKGQKAFTPIAVEQSEAILKAAPAAGLADERTVAAKPAEYIQTILAAHKSSHEIIALYELAQSFTGSLSLPETLAVVTRKLQKLIPYDTCVVYRCDEVGGAARVEHAAGFYADSFHGRGIRPGEGVTGWVIANNKSFANTDPTLDLSALGNRLECYRTLAVQPLVRHGKILGAIALYSGSLERYTEEQLRTLAQVAGLTSDALHNAMLFAETSTTGLTDELTGLPNGRYLRAFFEQERARAAHDEHGLAILAMDVNDFQSVSDLIGEESSGALFKEISSEIRAQLRREDVLVRGGSDRFIALLRDTAPPIVGEIAVRVQACMASHFSAVPGAERVALDVGIGQARIGYDGDRLEELLEAAERRLQADKAAHRSFSQFASSRVAQRYSFIE
jgi:diguanylate cyclase (GGDEF)-like protein/putative nucleotidyltransferase with HDIG domain